MRKRAVVGWGGGSVLPGEIGASGTTSGPFIVRTYIAGGAAFIVDDAWCVLSRAAWTRQVRRHGRFHEMADVFLLA